MHHNEEFPFTCDLPYAQLTTNPVIDWPESEELVSPGLFHDPACWNRVTPDARG